MTRTDRLVIAFIKFTPLKNTILSLPAPVFSGKMYALCKLGSSKYSIFFLTFKDLHPFYIIFIASLMLSIYKNPPLQSAVKNTGIGQAKTARPQRVTVPATAVTTTR